MGWSDVARGVQGAVQQQLAQRYHQQQLDAQEAERQHRAIREQRTDDRADQQFNLQLEQFDAGQARQTAQDALTAEDRAFTRAGTLAEQIPGDSFLPDTDPSVGMLERGGRGGLLQATPALEGMGADFEGPMNTPGGELPEAAQVGRAQGRIKTRTAAQANTEADNALAARIAETNAGRAGRTEDRAIATAAQNTPEAKFAAFKQQHEYELAHPKPTGGGGGDSLDTFEAKEKIKAKYAGSRPSVGAERQTLSYYNRAKEATENIAPLEDEIAAKSLAGQARLQMAPNWLQSDTNQSYRQAQRAFTEARLRKESGAAIPAGEYENDARTYFAQPGDGKAVLAQKRKAREVVLNGMKNASGKAYDEYYGQPASTPGGRGGIKILKIEEVP